MSINKRFSVVEFSPTNMSYRFFESLYSFNGAWELKLSFIGKRIVLLQSNPLTSEKSSAASALLATRQDLDLMYCTMLPRLELSISVIRNPSWDELTQLETKRAWEKIVMNRFAVFNGTKLRTWSFVDSAMKIALLRLMTSPFDSSVTCADHLERNVRSRF